MSLEPKILTALITFTVLWIAEGIFPFYQQFPSDLSSRLKHDARNLGMGVLNAAVADILFASLILATTEWAASHSFGLLHRLGGPDWLQFLAALLLLDAWMYLWHRANHTIPLLWRFHRMHHSDSNMDATSALRFHIGEILMSRLLLLVIVLVFGLQVTQIVWYGALMLPVILLHHSNVSLPRWLDRGLLWLIVTPALHRVHHSRRREETDSDYGSILSLWDRLFSTFRLRSDARTIHLGLDGMDGARWQSFFGMLRSPFMSR